MLAVLLLLAQANLAPAALTGPAALISPAADVTPAPEIFGRRCAVCHGFDGQGHTSRGVEFGVPDFSSAAWQKGITNEQIIHVITFGGKKRGMMSFSDRLTKEEIAAMVPFLRSLAAAQPAGQK
jgi:mono/diheme cytochrome c family protein